jgi:geranylgeranyl diphosphate synthase type I
MFTLAYISLQQLTKVVPASITLKVWDTFNRTNLDLTRGQHLDMRFEQEQSITIDAYLSMIAGKSASLVAACAEIGALIGSGSETIARHFGAFGHNLGLAFQIRDDILGIWGDPAITGKSAATDILGRKKSLPVLFGLQRSERLAEIYRQDSLSENDVSEAVSVLNALGADSFAEQTEKQYFSEAIASLNAADVHGEAAATLRALASALLSRDR